MTHRLMVVGSLQGERTRFMVRLVSRVVVLAAIAAGLSVSAASASSAAPDKPSNTCHLRTQADPNSRFLGTYSDSRRCLDDAASYNRNNLPPRKQEYCTFNTYNGYTDLHIDN